MPHRVLIAKAGLDGHDRGAKIIARSLRDDGFEVIYTGLRQRPAQIAAAAIAEDVRVIGLSVLSGAHLGIADRTLDALRQADAGDIPLLMGGAIPPGDIPRLLAKGVAGVLPTGSSIEEVVQLFRRTATSTAAKVDRG